MKTENSLVLIILTRQNVKYVVLRNVLKQWISAVGARCVGYSNFGYLCYSPPSNSRAKTVIVDRNKRVKKVLLRLFFRMQNRGVARIFPEVHTIFRIQNAHIYYFYFRLFQCARAYARTGSYVSARQEYSFTGFY